MKGLLKIHQKRVLTILAALAGLVVLGALIMPLTGKQAGTSSTDSAELEEYELEMVDGHFNPQEIEASAGKRIRINVRNKGKSAAEFESVQLRKEKVLAPGASSFIVIAPQSPGRYEFFDDFHQGSKGAIIVK